MHVVPEQLLAAMAAAFERARDAVVAVERAWEWAEPSLGAVAQQIESARREVVSLGLEGGVRDELAAIEQELEALRVRVAKDPLGASADVGARLAPRVAGLGARLAELGALRDARRGRASPARGRCGSRCGRMQARAVEAVERMPREVEGASAPGTPTDAGLVEGLGPWLAKIEAAATAGRWQAADVGLGKWVDAARDYLANDGKIAGALATVLARRDELSGRLSARRAQAAALASRGVALDSGRRRGGEGSREAPRRPPDAARESQGPRRAVRDPAPSLALGEACSARREERGTRVLLHCRMPHAGPPGAMQVATSTRRGVGLAVSRPVL